MTKQEALVEATRELLRELVKNSTPSAKWIAEQVGEDRTTFTHRLSGKRPSYRQLDTSFVVGILTALDVPVSDFFTQVEGRAEEILQGK